MAGASSVGRSEALRPRLLAHRYGSTPAASGFFSVKGDSKTLQQQRSSTSEEAGTSRGQCGETGSSDSTSDASQEDRFYREANDSAGDPSTSASEEGDEWRELEEYLAHSRALSAFPFAAIAASAAQQAAQSSGSAAASDALQAAQSSGSVAEQKYKELKAKFQKLYDKVYYGDVLPPVGSHQMSYARFLELLQKKRVKRIIMMSDGQVALVEVPAPGWASDYDSEIYRRDQPEVPYYKQRAEWDMEKMRYYVELPADIWDDGYFMHLIKMAQPLPEVDLEAKKLNLLRENQVTPELVVLDPNDAYGFLNQYAAQFVPIIGLILLRSVLGTGQAILKKFGKPKKSQMEEAAEQFTKFQGKEYNVDPEKDKKGKEKGKKLTTGVSYKDVAGIDAIVDDIEECMKMLLGDAAYTAAGARPPRGILLEGPPGTGKTYLARAMAGEHGVPFYSANGAEFVEMFQGIAAARIRSLFKTARKRAPAIVFIDEIDAIGKRRSTGPSDSGTQEREQGLLQLLFEMDGFEVDDRVLVIGATNRVDILDDALVRPGRFDRIIYMGRPSATNRKKILQVHARNKPIARENDDALLGQVAELTVGYSGAELANLMNESAILAVRNNQPTIDMGIVLEAMEKVRLGLPQPPLPDGEAKRRFALVQAGRAVAFALTPGLPPVERVSITPRAGAMSQILFVPQEFGKFGDQWHQLNHSPTKVNAVAPMSGEPLTTFELCCGLLVPLYAARATEEVLFGKQGVTLGTSKEVSRAGDLARYLVVGSSLHPKFRDSPVLYAMRMGGRRDPTTRDLEGMFEPFIKQMLEAAHAKALRLVQQHRDAIEQVAEEMLNRTGGAPGAEAVTGQRLIEIVEATPLAPVLPVDSEGRPNPAAEAGHSFTEALSRTLEPAPRAATAGQVAFAHNGPGRPGSAAFARGHGAADASSSGSHAQQANGSFEQVVVAGDGEPSTVAAALGELLGDEELSNAMQVVIGRKDLLEMIGPQSALLKADQVKRQLLGSPEAIDRLKAVRSFGTSANGAAFPPPPPSEQFAGPDLEDWTPPLEKEQPIKY